MNYSLEKIQLLDCTFRDGGQGLQSSYVYNVPGAEFSDDLIKESIQHLRNSKCDIVELGYMDDFSESMPQYASYSGIEDVSKNIPETQRDNQMYIALFTGPDRPLDIIPDYNASLIDGVRVIIRYSQLDKSLDFCEGLVKKGYKVFIQPMLTMRYTSEELDVCIDRANKMNAYALYFVDSFGYMDDEDVIRLFNYYNSRLNNNIRIGFHAHNNMNLAFSNVKTFIKESMKTNRKIIIDSTCLGIGQGAGNLQSEMIVPYLNSKWNKKYNYEDFLMVCEIVERLTQVTQWGYSLMWALPSVYKAAYKYSFIMRVKLNFSYVKINYVLKNMPNELKYRYTADDLKKILNKLQIDFQDEMI